jgi:hypothetical protein
MKTFDRKLDAMRAKQRRKGNKIFRKTELLSQ